jgi:hypothetical protein
MVSSVSLLSDESAAIILNAVRLPAAMMSLICSTVFSALVASSWEKLAAPKMLLSWVWASTIAGAAALTKPAWAVRSAS